MMGTQPTPLSATEMFDAVTELRARIDTLLSRGTTEEVLADTHADWIAIERDVKIFCDQLTSSDPTTAHSVLDDVREMIEILGLTPLPTGEGGARPA